MDDELRELRIEERELREGIEEATAQAARAERRLDDVGVELMHRGDTVRIAVGERAWTGVVVHVGTKLLTLRTQGGLAIDVDLGKLTSLAIVTRSRAGGRASGSRDPATMIARLRELEATREIVELGGAHLDPVTARVEVVAQTHAEVAAVDGTEWVIPLHSIAYVVSERPK